GRDATPTPNPISPVNLDIATALRDTFSAMSDDEMGTQAETHPPLQSLLPSFPADTDPFENEVFGGDQIESSDVTMLNEDMDNEVGGDNSISGDLIENYGGEKETVDSVPKDPSENVEVEKRRRSSRNVTRPARYAESIEESDGEGEPSAKKMRSESMDEYEKIVPQKKRSSCKGKSQLKTMKMNNEEKEKITEK
ncbi:hypothetical protein PMAYCL1PPCAC_20849, partial [Pristionchus mayeri]